MDGSLHHFKAGEARRNERVRKHNQKVEQEGVFTKGHKLILNFPEPGEEELTLIKQNIKTKTTAAQKKKIKLLLVMVLFAFSALLLLIFL